MVKILEVQTSELLDLKSFQKDNKEYSLVGSENGDKVYACDCDTFDGGEAPCDCNR